MRIALTSPTVPDRSVQRGRHDQRAHHRSSQPTWLTSRLHPALRRVRYYDDRLAAGWWGPSRSTISTRCSECRMCSDLKAGRCRTVIWGICLYGPPIARTERGRERQIWSISGKEHDHINRVYVRNHEEYLQTVGYVEPVVGTSFHYLHLPAHPKILDPSLAKTPRKNASTQSCGMMSNATTGWDVGEEPSIP